MNAQQLNYVIAQQHIAELHRAAEHARLATGIVSERHNPRHSHPVARLRAGLVRLTARLAPSGL